MNTIENGSSQYSVIYLHLIETFHSMQLCRLGRILSIEKKCWVKDNYVIFIIFFVFYQLNKILRKYFQFFIK